MEHTVSGERFRIVKRTKKICLGILRQVKNVANGVPEERYDYSAHDGAEDLIDAGRSLYPAQVQDGKQDRKKYRPKQAGIRNLITRPAEQIGHRLGRPDGADQGIKNVI